jgi:putative membrane protein
MSQNEIKVNLTNELAKERNREAADRTLMAWTRTSISLFGFGFAIAKSYEYVEANYLEETGRALDALHTPAIFGIGFIVLGMVGIFAGVIQYGRILKRIRSDRFTYIEPRPLPKLMAILLLVIGIFGLVAILL